MGFTNLCVLYALDESSLRIGRDTSCGLDHSEMSMQEIHTVPNGISVVSFLCQGEHRSAL